MFTSTKKISYPQSKDKKKRYVPDIDNCRNTINPNFNHADAPFACFFRDQNLVKIDGANPDVALQQALNRVKELSPNLPESYDPAYLIKGFKPPSKSAHAVHVYYYIEKPDNAEYRLRLMYLKKCKSKAEAELEVQASFLLRLSLGTSAADTRYLLDNQRQYHPDKEGNYWVASLGIPGFREFSDLAGKLEEGGGQCCYYSWFLATRCCVAMMPCLKVCQCCTGETTTLISPGVTRDSTVSGSDTRLSELHRCNVDPDSEEAASLIPYHERAKLYSRVGAMRAHLACLSEENEDYHGKNSGNQLVRNQFGDYEEVALIDFGRFMWNAMGRDVHGPKIPDSNFPINAAVIASFPELSKSARYWIGSEKLMNDPGKAYTRNDSVILLNSAKSAPCQQEFMASCLERMIAPFELLKAHCFGDRRILSNPKTAAYIYDYYEDRRNTLYHVMLGRSDFQSYVMALSSRHVLLKQNNRDYNTSSDRLQEVVDRVVLNYRSAFKPVHISYDLASEVMCRFNYLASVIQEIMRLQEDPKFSVPADIEQLIRQVLKPHIQAGYDLINQFETAPDKDGKIWYEREDYKQWKNMRFEGAIPNSSLYPVNPLEIMDSYPRFSMIADKKTQARYFRISHTQDVMVGLIYALGYGNDIIALDLSNRFWKRFALLINNGLGQFKVPQRQIESKALHVAIQKDMCHFLNAVKKYMRDTVFTVISAQFIKTVDHKEAVERDFGRDKVRIGDERLGEQLDVAYNALQKIIALAEAVIRDNSGQYQGNKEQAGFFVQLVDSLTHSITGATFFEDQLLALSYANFLIQLREYNPSLYDRHRPPMNKVTSAPRTWSNRHSTFRDDPFLFMEGLYYCHQKERDPIFDVAHRLMRQVHERRRYFRWTDSIMVLKHDLQEIMDQRKQPAIACLMDQLRLFLQQKNSSDPQQRDIARMRANAIKDAVEFHSTPGSRKKIRFSIAVAVFVFSMLFMLGQLGRRHLDTKEEVQFRLSILMLFAIASGMAILFSGRQGVAETTLRLIEVATDEMPWYRCPVVAANDVLYTVNDSLQRCALSLYHCVYTPVNQQAVPSMTKTGDDSV